MSSPQLSRIRFPTGYPLKNKFMQHEAFAWRVSSWHVARTTKFDGTHVRLYNPSMTPKEAKLLEEALRLSPEARAALAGSLLDSLEEPPDPAAEALWEVEISQRIRDIEDGSARMMPWFEVRRAIPGG